MLLSIDLSKDPVQESYQAVSKGHVFVGAIIKHLYDEKRIRLSNLEDRVPSRFIYKNDFSDYSTHLYGFTFSPKGEDVYLISKLKEQKQHLDVLSYNNLLSKYDYSCETNFLLLNKNIFPIDSHHIPKYISNYDFSKFFQFTEEIPIFQQFTPINMLLLA